MYWLVRAVIIIAVSVACGGCAYMQSRGNDALDILDLGITVTKQPHFAAYCGLQSLLSVGYSNLEGHMFGVGERKAGWLNMSYHAGGSVLEGYEQWSYTRPKANMAEGREMLTPGKRGVGLGLLYGEYPQRPIGLFNCPKLLHVGWVGLNLNCKIGEVLDFVLGWITLDIGEDDGDKLQSFQ